LSISRAITSPPVPGASGTTAWIGFDGQFARILLSHSAPHAAATAARDQQRTVIASFATPP
jgi:hypothetical protein